MYFHYFAIIYSWKRARPFIWINLKSLVFRMIRALFRGSGREDGNKKSVQTDGGTTETGNQKTFQRS